MRITLFHPVQLPPKNYGGVERVLLWLAKALVDRGHQVRVAALAGSVLPQGCELIHTERKSYSSDELQSLIGETDIFHAMAPLPKKVWESLAWPKLLTIHGNGKPGEEFPLNSVFVSRNHAVRHGGEVYVYNGVDPSEFRFAPETKQPWHLFLSKTSWRVKNLRGAMRIAKKAKVPLRIAGGSGPLICKIQAVLEPSFRWMGPVHGEKKKELLSQAQSLLFPVQWEEPFGLVVIEALLSGTPVLSYPRGSLPELITPEVGALLQTEEEWVECLSGPLKWDSEACRRHAETRFLSSQMAESYEKIYQRVMQGESLHQKHPKGTLETSVLSS